MVRRRKRYLDNTAPADNTSNVVRPINRMIQVKQQDTPARREKETREYQANVERGQRITSTFARTSAGRRAANKAYAIESQKAKQEAAKEEAAAVVGSLFKPLMPSTYVDMAAAIKNGQVNVTDALAAPYLNDSWSMRNPGKALVADFITPFVASKGAQLLNQGTRGLRLARAMNRWLAEVPSDYLGVSNKVITVGNQSSPLPLYKGYIPEPNFYELGPSKWFKAKAERDAVMQWEPQVAAFNNTPFYYDINGNFIPNPNYYYRRGWGIIDDAQQTGVIRVPPGDYKTEALKKYPWLDNGNSFSTTLLNHKFPYFSEGKLWGQGAKLGKEPEDLIAIHKNAGNARWVAGSKFGALKAEAKPSEYGGRGTPLINGETNKFPTDQAHLFKLNDRTGRYEPINTQWDNSLLNGLGLNPTEEQILETLQRTEPIPRDILRRPISNLSDKEKVQRSVANGVNDAVRFLRGKNYRNRLKAIGYTSDEAEYIIENQISNIKRADVETYPEGNSLLGRNGSATPYRNLAGEMHYQIAAQPKNSLGYNPRVTGMHEALHVGSNQHLVDDFTSLPPAIREHNASIRPIVNDDYDAARVFQRLTDEELRARALTTIAASERIGMPVMDYIDAFGFRGVGSDIRPMMNPNFNANAAELRDYFTRESLKNYLDKVAGVAMPLGVGYGVYKNQ